MRKLLNLLTLLSVIGCVGQPPQKINASYWYAKPLFAGSMDVNKNGFNPSLTISDSTHYDGFNSTFLSMSSGNLAKSNGFLFLNYQDIPDSVYPNMRVFNPTTGLSIYNLDLIGYARGRNQSAFNIYCYDDSAFHFGDSLRHANFLAFHNGTFGNGRLFFLIDSNYNYLIGPAADTVALSAYASPKAAFDMKDNGNPLGIWEEGAGRMNILDGKTVIGPVTDTSSLQVTRGDELLLGSLNMPNLTNQGDPGASGTSEIKAATHHFLHTGNPDGNENFSTYLGLDCGAAARDNTGPTQSATAMGEGAFQAFHGGNYRGCAFGTGSQQNITTGGGNTSYGWASTNTGTNYSNNLAIGSAAGVNIDGGSSNNTLVGTLAAGTESLDFLFGGVAAINNSTIVGYKAAAVLAGATLDSVVVVGTGSGKTTASGTLTNTTIIGNGITTDQSNVVIIGNNTQQVVFPHYTTAQKLAIASPVEGSQVYDTTLHQMSYYNGTGWVNF